MDDFKVGDRVIDDYSGQQSTVIGLDKTTAWQHGGDADVLVVRYDNGNEARLIARSMRKL